jgi:crotonobetainyl-CoA:carnitine CoA-transferase CaiB-like acyl-CoA transferase
MTQRITRSSGASFATTRCPIRIDGARLTAPLGSPGLGEHTAAIVHEFALDDTTEDPA